MTVLLDDNDATIEVPPADLVFSRYSDVVRANRDIWVEALKSGDWKQGRAYLARQEDTSEGEFSYCCLGVACEISGEMFDTEIRGTQYQYKAYNNNTTTPDPKLMWIMGLSNATMDMLMALNDSKQFTFEQIAAVVEVMPLDRPDDFGNPNQWRD